MKLSRCCLIMCVAIIPLFGCSVFNAVANVSKPAVKSSDSPQPPDGSSAAASGAPQNEQKAARAPKAVGEVARAAQSKSAYCDGQADCIDFASGRMPPQSLLSLSAPARIIDDTGQKSGKVLVYEGQKIVVGIAVASSDSVLIEWRVRPTGNVIAQGVVGALEINLGSLKAAVHVIGNQYDEDGGEYFADAWAVELSDTSVTATAAAKKKASKEKSKEAQNYIEDLFDFHDYALSISNGKAELSVDGKVVRSIPFTLPEGKLTWLLEDYGGWDGKDPRFQFALAGIRVRTNGAGEPAIVRDSGSTAYMGLDLGMDSAAALTTAKKIMGSTPNIKCHGGGPEGEVQCSGPRQQGAQLQVEAQFTANLCKEYRITRFQQSKEDYTAVYSELKKNWGKPSADKDGLVVWCFSGKKGMGLLKSREDGAKLLVEGTAILRSPCN